MTDFPPLSEFLRKAGVSKNTSVEEMTALKKEYAKAYQAWYHKCRRKKETHRFTIRFNKSEWAELNRIIKQYAPTDFTPPVKQTNLAPFIKQIVLVYISKQDLPRDPKPIRDVQQELKMVVNILNRITDDLARLRRQVVLHHSSGEEIFTALGEQYAGLQKTISVFEQRFNSFIYSPPTLKNALIEMLEKQPEKMEQLIEYLLKIQKERNAGHKKHVQEG